MGVIIIRLLLDNYIFNDLLLLSVIYQGVECVIIFALRLQSPYVSMITP